MSRTTQVSRYQKGKTNLDFTGARDSEWQWHQLDHMQVCTSLQTDNHASTTPLRLPHQTRAESPVEKFKRLPGLSSIFNRATLRYPWLCLSVCLSRMPFLSPNQQCQSTEGNRSYGKSKNVKIYYFSLSLSSLYC